MTEHIPWNDLFDRKLSLYERMVPWPIRHPLGYWKRRTDWLRPGHLYQRCRYGYSERDTWSFDHYLAGVIAGGAQRIRDRSISYPCELTPEEWNTILDKIVLGFKAHKDDSWAESPERDEALQLFAKWYTGLWD